MLSFTGRKGFIGRTRTGHSGGLENMFYVLENAGTKSDGGAKHSITEKNAVINNLKRQKQRSGLKITNKSHHIGCIDSILSSFISILSFQF